MTTQNLIKAIKVSEKNWQRMTELKLELKARAMNNVIDYLFYELEKGGTNGINNS